MDNKQQIALQEQVLEYFIKYDDETFIAVVDSFVFHIPHRISGPIIQKFLDENSLQLAYVNYIVDFKNKDKMFSRASMSEVSIIEAIKQAMLVASFNRFRHTQSSEKKLTTLKKRYKNVDESIDKLMDAGSTDRYHEALEELRDYYVEHLDKKK